MYRGINTLKSRWFKIALAATLIWDGLFISFLWIIFWGASSVLGSIIFFITNIFIIGTLVLVGIRILLNPPIPRPWYIRFGIWLSFIAGINAGLIAFIWNEGQIPYLPFYSVFTTVGLLTLDGYLLHYIHVYMSKSHQEVEAPHNEPPRIIQATTTPMPANAPVPKNKLAIVIILTAAAQICVAYWAYTSV